MKTGIHCPRVFAAAFKFVKLRAEQAHGAEQLQIAGRLPEQFGFQPVVVRPVRVAGDDFKARGFTDGRLLGAPAGIE